MVEHIYNKYGGPDSLPVYSLNNTGCLTQIRTRIFIRNFDNSEDILTKLSTDLFVFLLNVTLLRECMDVATIYIQTALRNWTLHTWECSWHYIRRHWPSYSAFPALFPSLLQGPTKIEIKWNFVHSFLNYSAHKICITHKQTRRQILYKFLK